MSANSEPELQSGKKILIGFKNRVLRATVGAGGRVQQGAEGDSRGWRESVTGC